MDTALQVLRECSEDTPLVGIIGSRTRTTYDDQDFVLMVLEMLREVRLFRPVHSGKPPFDMHLAQLCGVLGLADVFMGDGDPDDYSSRLDPYMISADMLDHICLLVVFPREREAVEDTDPLVAIASELGIPVVALRRSGDTEYR